MCNLLCVYVIEGTANVTEGTANVTEGTANVIEGTAKPKRRKRKLLQGNAIDNSGM